MPCALCTVPNLCLQFGFETSKKVKNYAIPMLKRSISCIETTAYHFVYTLSVRSLLSNVFSFAFTICIFVNSTAAWALSMQTTNTNNNSNGNGSSCSSTGMCWPSKHPSFKYDDYESAAVSKMICTTLLTWQTKDVRLVFVILSTCKCIFIQLHRKNCVFALAPIIAIGSAIKRGNINA